MPRAPRGRRPVETRPAGGEGSARRAAPPEATPAAALPAPLAGALLAAGGRGAGGGRVVPPATVLGLQRQVGNAAVQRLLRRPALQRRPAGGGDMTIQRALGDGHDLTSPRFAGEPRLEACFDDEARLTIGATGPAVAKVQQALIDLGHDLGPSGADGVYGQRTWNAVKQFKAAQKLGFEHMGDVGPGTMTRLNQLFPGGGPVKPEAPPPTEAEEEGAACPTDDVIVAALAGQAGGEAAAGGDTPVGGGPHISMAEAVKRFKDKVNVAGVSADTNIAERGQFFWGTQMWTAISAELTRMDADPGAKPFVAKARAARDTIWDRQDATKQIQELDQIAATTTSPEKANMLALLRGSGLSGGGLEQILWAALNKDATNALPNLAPHRSLRVLRSLVTFDKSGCGTHALQAATRLKKKGGLNGAPGKGTAFAARLATTSTRDLRPKPDASSAIYRGDVMGQSGVASAVDAMRKALDDGHVVHARVLSGVGHGSSAPAPNPKAKPTPIGPPPEEHSLLIIGFDGNTFVFSDPDASVSHTPEDGFGVLTFDSATGRLSTAADDSDMIVSTGGKHRRGDKRYQIISLTTV
jgi:peptidoglycan hydrolase-like protein with peptidoglycan-binding domain